MLLSRQGLLGLLAGKVSMTLGSTGIGNTLESMGISSGLDETEQEHHHDKIKICNILFK